MNCHCETVEAANTGWPVIALQLGSLTRDVLALAAEAEAEAQAVADAEESNQSNRGSDSELKDDQAKAE